MAVRTRTPGSNILNALLSWIPPVVQFGFGAGSSVLYRCGDSLYIAVYAKRRPDNFIQLPDVVLLLDLMISLFLIAVQAAVKGVGGCLLCYVHCHFVFLSVLLMLR